MSIEYFFLFFRDVGITTSDVLDLEMLVTT